MAIFQKEIGILLTVFHCFVLPRANNTERRSLKNCPPSSYMQRAQHNARRCSCLMFLLISLEEIFLTKQHFEEFVFTLKESTCIQCFKLLSHPYHQQSIIFFHETKLTESVFLYCLRSKDRRVSRNCQPLFSVSSLTNVSFSESFFNSLVSSFAFMSHSFNSSR